MANYADWFTDDERSLLTDAEGRRLMTRLSPKKFALIYLLHHITDAEDNITFATFHDEWYTQMLSWVKPITRPRQERHAFISPRDSGKSTNWFLVAPLWAAAHGHKQFIAAFADAASQAEVHLASFRHELESNELLRYDFPELCRTKTDNRGMLRTLSGFSFAARGIDAASLGLKVGERRPDVIICDDVEPSESNYSAYQAKQRLITLTDAILPLNERAHVVLVGTVTMMDSVVHQLVRSAVENHTEEWIKSENFRVHYHPPIITHDDGSESSVWPEKWPLDYLNTIRGTRSYAKNFENQPISDDGIWWRVDHLVYEQPITPCDRVVLVVDGAVTTKKTSDYTGISVVGLSVDERKFYVKEALGVRLGGEELRAKVIDLTLTHDVNYILCEANQGADLWHSVFHDMPVKVDTFSSSESKHVRIRRLLSVYERAGGHVVHERKLPHLERQQLAYPNVTHDDVLDAVAAGIEHLLHMLLRHLQRTSGAAEVKRYLYVG